MVCDITIIIYIAFVVHSNINLYTFIVFVYYNESESKAGPLLQLTTAVSMINCLFVSFLRR